MSDPNDGSLVLFKRYGCPVNSDAHRSRQWELGRVVSTFFVDDHGGVTEDTERILGGHCTAWLTIDPEKPEGASAPSCVTVPLDEHHVDVIVHGTEVAADA